MKRPVSETKGKINDGSKMWADDIQPAIDHLLNKVNGYISNPKDTAWSLHRPMEVYTACYNLTMTCKFSYEVLEYFHKMQINTIRDFCSKFKIKTLRDMVFQYEGFRWVMKWLRCFFHHMNRMMDQTTFMSEKQGMDQMMRQIRDHYLFPQMKQVRSLLIKHWSGVRMHNYKKDYELMRAMYVIMEIDDSLMRSISSIFLKETASYFESIQYKEGIKEYMRTCARVARREHDMIRYYLLSETCTQKLFLDILINPFFTLILNDAHDGWEAVMNADKEEDIKTSYAFLQFGDQHEWIERHSDFLNKKMQDIGSNMSRLLEFYMRQTRLYQDVVLHASIRKEMSKKLETSFLNFFRTGSKPTILLMRMMDTMMRKKSTKVEDLISMVSLMLFCPDRDYMHTLFKEHLRRRLLENPSSLEKEEIVISMLSSKLGASFALNFKTMLDEIRGRRTQIGCVSMHVLSRVVWGFDVSPVNLQWKSPLQHLLNSMVPRVEGQRHDLSMMYGSVVLERSPHEFLMTPVQAIVILSLQEMDRQEASLEELVVKLGVVDDIAHNVRGVLKSLSREKTPMLVADEDTQMWRINNQFQPKSRRTLMPPVLPHKMEDDESGDDPRQHTIMLECSIVHAMKLHGPMTHVQLAHRIGKKMNTSVQSLRAVIDSLLQREYISREGTMLHYVP